MKQLLLVVGPALHQNVLDLMEALQITVTNREVTTP